MPAGCFRTDAYICTVKNPFETAMAIHKIKILPAAVRSYLAEKIAASFGTTLGESEVLRFSDGEFQPCFN